MFVIIPSKCSSRLSSPSHQTCRAELPYSTRMRPFGNYQAKNSFLFKERSFFEKIANFANYNETALKLQKRTLYWSQIASLDQGSLQIF